MPNPRTVAEWPTGPFSVIYADPPWAWSKTPLVDRGAARTVEKEYPTLQPDEIAALPVAQLAAKNSVLFLWATGPKLQIALTVMETWGFTFKTIGFCWVKRNGSGSLFWGMGFYTRANCELCLIGTRGAGLKRKSASIHQIIEAPLSKHSAKPLEVRQRIESLYDGPYLEMFAREKTPGWAVWGNEI